MRRMLLALCAVLLLAVSCPLASPQGGEAYELYFQAADLRTASGGDALRAETVYLEGTEDHGTLALMEELLTLLLEGPESAHLTSRFRRGPRCCPWSWRAPGLRWISPRPTGPSPALR